MVNYDNYDNLEQFAEEVLEDANDAKKDYNEMLQKRFASLYKVIKNYSYVDFDNPEIIKDYNIWLRRQKLLLDIYVEYMRANNVSPANAKAKIGEHPVELFKGDLDTIKGHFRDGIEVYSKYANTMSIEKYPDGNHSGFHSDVIVSRKGYPCLKTKEIIKDRATNGQPITILFDNPAILPLTIDKFDSFFTHNPYTRNEEKTIISFLHNEDLNVVYGFYGLHADLDTADKFVKFIKLGIELVNDDKENKFMHTSGSREDVGDYSIGLIYKPAKNKQEIKEETD